MGQRTRIGLKEVRALAPGGIVWDTAVAGFGARRQKGDAVSYVLFYRTAERRQRWHTIGRHGSPWTPDSARAEARRVLSEAVKGTDPTAERQAVRKALTIGDLCERYWADVSAGRLLVRGGRPKKPSTLASDKGRIDGHIRPLLGRVSVMALSRDDVNKFMHAVASGETAKTHKTKTQGLSIIRGGRGVATRTVGLLGAILAYGIEQGLRTDNPAHGVRKFAEAKRERRLSEAEYRILGDAIRCAEAERTWPPAIAALKFMVLTGWRRGEVLGLKWNEVDLARRTAQLTDTKTGKSTRPLSHAACDVLREAQFSRELVFPASRGTGEMIGFYKIWRRISKIGDVPADISPHSLRHSFASLAGDMEYSESTIGALIGHKGRTVTSRYVHSADAVLLAAADKVAQATLDMMGPPHVVGGAVIQMRLALG